MQEHEHFFEELDGKIEQYMSADFKDILYENPFWKQFGPAPEDYKPSARTKREFVEWFETSKNPVEQKIEYQGEIIKKGDTWQMDGRGVIFRPGVSM